MRNKFGLKVLAISIALVMVASGVAMYGYSGIEGGEGISESKGGKGVISLVAPPFIGVAGAAEAAGGDAFPEDEAGISAYVNISHEIDLEKAKGAFKSIETANETYIIGQIALDGYDPEYVAPHAYVHKDGWIVTYYLKNEPSSKIMQWNGYDGGKITTTTLADTIKKVCDSIQSKYDPPGTLYNLIKDNVSYYDFEFPNANRMMLITEWVEGGEGKQSDQFNLTVPTECELYEASWSHYCHTPSNGAITSSEVSITDSIDYYPVYTLSKLGFVDESSIVYKYGILIPEQLSADGILHIITVKHDSYSFYGGAHGSFKSSVAIVLIYRTS